MSREQHIYGQLQNLWAASVSIGIIEDNLRQVGLFVVSKKLKKIRESIVVNVEYINLVSKRAK